MKIGNSYCFPQLIAVLFFRYSCLVSSSPSEAGQFNWEYWPLVQEIISVIQYLPCFRGGLLLCFLLRVECWEFVSLPHPLSLGQIQWATCPFHCLCFITVCCLFFSFVWQFGFGCCSLPQEIISWPITCPVSGSGLSPTWSQTSLPFLCLFTESLVLTLVLCPAPFLQWRISILRTPSSVCVWIQFAVCFPL
jgi:hypothetical protein